MQGTTPEFTGFQQIYLSLYIVQLMDSLKIASQTWAKTMENKKPFSTVLTHFFNLTTTATNHENLGAEVFNKTRLQR